MDLNSIMNNEAGENSRTKQAAPGTPIQTGPQQNLRDYSHPPQASPGKHPSQDYAAVALQPGGLYPSPTSYQGQGTFTRPPPPPPIQAPPQNDLRSPAGSYTSHSTQSPFRQTPTSGMSNNQYPFPQGQQTPQSPAQHIQYPPSFPHRDSFSQSNGPSHLQHHNQTRGSPAPQTPPIGIPGSAHPYLQHQRSQSSLSTSTPSSAQSQQHYFGQQYPQDSPVSAGNFPPSQIHQHQRQQSQPGTPLGPPISHQRQSSGGHPQPSSPYQQRGPSSGPFAQLQTSPAPPPPASIPRLPSTPTTYDSRRTSLSEQQGRSQSERERSLSVSPKTRLPSQPTGEYTILQPQNGNIISGKRKMDDREAFFEEPRKINQPEVKTRSNGDNRIPSSYSPQQAARKRIRYTEPPIWAQSVRGRKSIYAASRPNTVTNGKQPTINAPTHTAPQPLLKSETNGHRQISPSVGPSNDEPHPSLILGPWEWSILNKRPQDQMTKAVADWLYHNVVSRNDFGELTSRGVELEIEAKLGQLIDRETNYRYILPVQTECVLEENARLAFRSSMTENQHSTLNQFLNTQVQNTHPGSAAGQNQRRVPIEYLHRRETDKFYELPASYVNSLPPALKAYIRPRQGLKVRVSHDQKTNEILAAIIKVRVNDLDIYNPRSPLDCRISINFEMRYNGNLEELKAIVSDSQQPDRNKDRLSYTQSCYQIDLTQVTQLEPASGGNQIKKEHELEIEVLSRAIVEQGQRARDGQPNQYQCLVEGFLNNMRVLAKTVPAM